MTTKVPVRPTPALWPESRSIAGMASMPWGHTKGGGSTGQGSVFKPLHSNSVWSRGGTLMGPTIPLYYRTPCLELSGPGTLGMVCRVRPQGSNSALRFLASERGPLTPDLGGLPFPLSSSAFHLAPKLKSLSGCKLWGPGSSSALCQPPWPGLLCLPCSQHGNRMWYEWGAKGQATLTCSVPRWPPCILRVTGLHLLKELEHANRCERHPKIWPAGKVELSDERCGFLLVTSPTCELKRSCMLALIPCGRAAPETGG